MRGFLDRVSRHGSGHQGLWRPRGVIGEPFQVLDGDGQQELVPGAGQAPKSESDHRVPGCAERRRGEPRQSSASTAARLAFYDEPPKAFLLLWSISLDSSAAGIYWTVCAGGAMVLPHEKAETGMAALGDIIARRG